ncbi:amino acid permease 8-like protein [Cinnamomum micranthum f. kanehirae]|uniref:Amino acid permease 8-like protein n=1 Tax=Cinnamomum micranthum f. kanehirae TaxID=337451 RepID=A0A3S3NET9_9MAGN|nr:amino acid permease 8-like protein [Cinnamomum micranthum f. kanehirae]
MRDCMDSQCTYYNSSSGVLSLAWAIAQLGWIAGPATLFIFSFITFFTSTLLADCYRSPDPVYGKRNYTYKDAVRANLGGTKFWICGLAQYFNLFGITIGYTITASISMAAIQKSNCFHRRGHDASCKTSNNPFMIGFGIVEILVSDPKLSQAIIALHCRSIHVLWLFLDWCRPCIGQRNTGKTSITGADVGADLSESQKVWTAFRALGDIAFAYSYSLILIEIQDTLKSPAENKNMKKASLIGVSTTTIFYVLCGCIGYAAFGNHTPGNLLTGFGFYEPFWLVDLANMCIVVHLVGAFQVFCQPLFAAVESWTVKKWPNAKFIAREHTITWKSFKYKFSTLWLLWRTIFIVITTTIAMILPFFNDILALLGAIGFWPLTVYFPVEMYISKKKIRRFTPKWTMLQLLSFICLLVSLAAACGSIEGVIEALRVYKPFQTKQ